MVWLNYRTLCNLLLLVLCCSIPTTYAFGSFGFSTKDLLMGIVIRNILKPRLQPFPIFIPRPFKIHRHVRKPYPMQMDSYLNHQMGGQEPWAMDLNSGSHALAELHSASENIDSLVQQLSMSPDVIKANPSDSIQTFQNENFNDYGGLSNYNGGGNMW